MCIASIATGNDTFRFLTNLPPLFSVCQEGANRKADAFGNLRQAVTFLIARKRFGMPIQLLAIHFGPQNTSLSPPRRPVNLFLRLERVQFAAPKSVCCIPTTSRNLYASALWPTDAAPPSVLPTRAYTESIRHLHLTKAGLAEIDTVRRLDLVFWGFAVQALEELDENS